MSWNFLILISVASWCRIGSEDFGDIGFMSRCPGSEKPVVVTDPFLNKNVFFVVQIHKPQYYRKRYYFHKAVDGIGRDPNIDFKNRKTLVLLDGYLASSNFPIARIVAGNYLTFGNYNTITIDSQLLVGFIYPVAARTSRQVGNITATLLYGLRKYGLKAKDIELAGVSLGGQTVSFVGKHYYRLSGERVGVINSFDPAGPCFRDEKWEERIAPTDAKFVQIIHTNNEGAGTGTASGHVDFYVNGGEFQNVLYTHSPFCEEGCSHSFSFIYFFTAFLYPYKFVGVKCDSVTQAREHGCYDNDPVVTNFLGPKADPTKPGIFYVPVSADAPFFAPDDFLEKRIIYPLLYNDAFSRIDNFVLGS